MHSNRIIYSTKDHKTQSISALRMHLAAGKYTESKI